MKRRTFMKLAAAGLSSALIPLLEGCGRAPEQYGTSRFPTLEQPLTPTSRWYFVSVQGAYEADLESYRLRVNGAVDHPLTLTIDELESRFEVFTQHDTLACVGNAPGGGLLSSTIFRGVRVRDVLEAAGIDGRVSSAMITGLDGFLAMRSLEELSRDNAMLAFEMGMREDSLERLPIEHGFPLRILTPGHYGYMQPKWIERITVTDDGHVHDVLRRSMDFFSGPIQITSDFSRPRSGARLDVGAQEVIGWAFGDGRPIARVELSVDGGGWQPAEIMWNTMDDESLPTTLWSLWRLAWDAPEGDHTLAVRAIYEDGETQYEGNDYPFSGGAISRIKVEVR